MELVIRRLRELGYPDLAPTSRSFEVFSADHLPAHPSDPVGRGEILVAVDDKAS